MVNRLNGIPIIGQGEDRSEKNGQVPGMYALTYDQARKVLSQFAVTNGEIDQLRTAAIYHIGRLYAASAKQYLTHCRHFMDLLRSATTPAAKKQMMLALQLADLRRYRAFQQDIQVLAFAWVDAGRTMTDDERDIIAFKALPKDEIQRIVGYLNREDDVKN